MKAFIKKDNKSVEVEGTMEEISTLINNNFLVSTYTETKTVITPKKKFYFVWNSSNKEQARKLFRMGKNIDEVAKIMDLPRKKIEYLLYTRKLR